MSKVKEKGEEEFITIREFSKILGVCTRTTISAITNKEIPSVRVGKSWYIPKSFLNEV